MREANQREATGRARILVVIGSLNRGGTEQHLLQVMPRLDRRRFVVEVFTLAEQGALAGDMCEQGIGVIKPWIAGGHRNLLFRASRIVLIAFQLWLHALRTRPRIMHCFLPASYLIGLPVAILAGVRIRLMSRRSLNVYQQARPALARLEHWMHRFTRAVTGNSRRVVGELINEGVAPDRIALIYNGIHVNALRNSSARTALRRQIGIASETLVLTIVANLIPYKGHQDLLRAMAQAREQIQQEWALLIVGRDDGIGQMLADLATDLGIGANVQFLGERGDVGEIFAMSDIALLVSHQEGFSNAVLEAMTEGVPLIVTDVGGNAEAVVDGQTGRVVPPHAPDALATAIVELANDPPRRGQMGRAARMRVEDLFSEARCVDAYNELYAAVLAGLPVSGAAPGAVASNCLQSAPAEREET